MLHINSSIWCLDFWCWPFWLSRGGILKWFWSAFFWLLRCRTRFYLSLMAIILWQLSWFNNRCTWTLYIFLKSHSGGQPGLVGDAHNPALRSEAGWTGVDTRLWFTVRSSQADRSEVYLEAEVNWLATTGQSLSSRMPSGWVLSPRETLSQLQKIRRGGSGGDWTKPWPVLHLRFSIILTSSTGSHLSYRVSFPLPLNVSSVFWMKWIWNWSSGRKKFRPFLNIKWSNWSVACPSEHSTGTNNTWGLKELKS